MWTGVRLCDLLAAVGITRPSKEHRFVHFEGPLGELPQGKTGSYGTSIDLGWALDRERDVLLAFKQNGELLTPDHGFPLRTLLPGCIGGRMIKWLSSMWASCLHTGREDCLVISCSVVLLCLLLSVETRIALRRSPNQSGIITKLRAVAHCCLNLKAAAHL